MPIKTVITKSFFCSDNKEFFDLHKAEEWQKKLDEDSAKNLVTDTYMKLKGFEGRPAKIKRAVIIEFYDFLRNFDLVNEEKARTQFNENTNDEKLEELDAIVEDTKPVKAVKSKPIAVKKPIEIISTEGTEEVTEELTEELVKPKTSNKEPSFKQVQNQMLKELGIL